MFRQHILDIKVQVFIEIVVVDLCRSDGERCYFIRVGMVRTHFKMKCLPIKSVYLCQVREHVIRFYKCNIVPALRTGGSSSMDV